MSDASATNGVAEAGKAEAGNGLKLISLNDHPTASARIRRSKAWGGLIAFAIVTFGSTSHGGTLSDALLRGLVAGVIGFHVTWLAAVIAARRILKAQTVAVIERSLERRRRVEAGRS
jgi:hypothetical protein